MQLVGKQKISFTNDQGQVIQGVKLHYVGPDDRVAGMAALTKFVSMDSPLFDAALQLQLGEFDIIYGRRDSIQKFIQDIKE